MIRFNVFLCHRRSDGQTLALAIREFLRRAGITVFMDVSEHKPGVFSVHLRNAVRSSDYLVAIKTSDMVLRDVLPSPVSDDWVEFELTTAFESRVPIIAIEREKHGNFPCSVTPNFVIPYLDGALDDTLQTLKQNLHRSVRSILHSFVRRRIGAIAYLTSLCIACMLLTFLHSALHKTAPRARAVNQEIILKIDGAKKRIKEIESKPITTLLLIDTTITMHSKFDRIVQHAEYIIKRRPASEIIVVAFSDYEENYVVREWVRGSDIHATIESIANLPMTDGGDQPEASDVAMAFAHGLCVGEKLTRAHVILFTDAPANNRDDFVAEIRKLKSIGATVTLVACDVSHLVLGWAGLDDVSIEFLQPVKEE